MVTFSEYLLFEHRTPILFESPMPSAAFYTWRAFDRGSQTKLLDFVRKNIVPALPAKPGYMLLDPKEYHVSMVMTQYDKTLPGYQLDKKPITVKPLGWRMLGFRYLVLVFEPHNDLTAQIEKAAQIAELRFPNFIPHTSVLAFDDNSAQQIDVKKMFPTPKFPVRLLGEEIVAFSEPTFLKK